MARSTYSHTRTIGYSTPTSPAVSEPIDALSSPGNDDLISAALSLWPKGAAWNSPDGEAISLSSVLALLTRVMIAPFVLLYARIYRLALQSSPAFVSEMLDEREIEYDLPGSCFTGDLTTEQRILMLQSKVRADPVATPQDFVRLAAGYGFEIAIEEPCMFTCGFSECGGEHETGEASQEIYWIFRVKGEADTYFECGVSECGYDPLFSFGSASELLCAFMNIAPAWTIPVIEPWIYAAVLIDETGRIISDEYGNAIAVIIDG